MAAYTDAELEVLMSDMESDLVGSNWPGCLDVKPRAFRVLSAIWRVMRMAAEEHHADLVLLDVGPNIGALSRAALVSADYVVVPLAPDLHSLQGLRNLGPTLNRWRQGWLERRERNPLSDLDLRLIHGIEDKVRAVKRGLSNFSPAASCWWRKGRRWRE